MTKSKLLKQAQDWLYDYDKRKGWFSDFAGAHTSPEENKAAMIIAALVNKLKAKK